MTFLPVRTRSAAGLVALVGLAGLAIRFTASLDITGSAGAALWSMLRFFTIIGNALAVVVMAGIALGARPLFRPRIVGCVTLVMLLIGIVYALLLRDLVELGSGAHVANVILHYVMPPLTLGFWLLLAPKGGLSWVDPVRWAMLPLAYLPYALARAAEDGRYAYPFIDVDRLGWAQVLTNAASIAMGFLLAGWALVWLDRRLGGPAASALGARKPARKGRLS